MLNVSLQSVSFLFLDQIDVLAHLDLHDFLLFLPRRRLVHLHLEHAHNAILATGKQELVVKRESKAFNR